MLAERPAKGKKKETALLGPGSVLDAAAYLSSTRSRACMRAATSCRLAAFGAQELEALLVRGDDGHYAPCSQSSGHCLKRADSAIGSAGYRLSSQVCSCKGRRHFLRKFILKCSSLVHFSMLRLLPWVEWLRCSKLCLQLAWRAGMTQERHLT